MKKVLFLFLALQYYYSYSQVVIQEVYGAGGNSGAVFHDDYILLYNNGGSIVDLSSYSIHYAPAGSLDGTNWAALNLTGSISANGFYLIRITTSVTVGIDFPAGLVNITWPIGGSGINAAAGKIALLNTQSTINTQNPPAGNVDFLGYGTGASGANSAEGTAETGPGNNQTSLARSPLGADTNNNSVDFVSKNGNLTTGHSPNNLIFPVRLEFFDAKIKLDKVTLIFYTTSESNFSHFEIQKSKDARGFESIGRIESAGFESEKNEYSFIDEKPFAGNNYYRLKMVDKDGTEDYSKMINVNFDGKALAVFYPNPTQDFVRFENIKTEDISSVVVHKINGEYLGETHPTTDGIDISGFKSRELILQLKMKNNQTITSRIIKNL